MNEDKSIAQCSNEPYEIFSPLKANRSIQGCNLPGVGWLYVLDLALAPRNHLAIFFVCAGLGGLSGRFVRIPQRYSADPSNNHLRLVLPDPDYLSHLHDSLQVPSLSLL